MKKSIKQMEVESHAVKANQATTARVLLNLLNKHLMESNKRTEKFKGWQDTVDEYSKLINVGIESERVLMEEINMHQDDDTLVKKTVS